MVSLSPTSNFLFVLSSKDFSHEVIISVIVFDHSVASTCGIAVGLRLVGSPLPYSLNNSYISTTLLCMVIIGNSIRLLSRAKLHHGVMISWCRGIMIPWCHEFMNSVFQGFWLICFCL